MGITDDVSVSPSVPQRIDQPGEWQKSGPMRTGIMSRAKRSPRRTPASNKGCSHERFNFTGR